MLDSHIAAMLRDSGRRIIITGASGWIGRATIAMLRQSLGEAALSRIACFGSSARRIAIDDDLAVEQRPLTELRSLAPQPSFLLHLAFLTKEKASAMDEAAYRQANRDMASTVLDAAADIGVDRIFLASSGAAKLADDEQRPTDFRLYGEMKREDEDRFAEWAMVDGRRCVAIGRIFNIAGPYINKVQSYALASFIVDALAGRPITVRAAHPVMRGYVAIEELISLILAILIEGRPGITRFETGGDPMELKAVAEAVAAKFGGAPVERAAITNPVPDTYLGDDLPYRGLLEKYGIGHIPFDQQVVETAEYLARESSPATPILGWRT